MNSREISDYKSKIMKHLIRDKEIVELVDPNKNADYPDDLLDSNIFPYNRIPNTEQEVSVYITVMVDIPSPYTKNTIARNVNIKFRVYAHESLMKVTGKAGDRTDLISARIDELMSESFDFGIGPVELHSNTEHVLDSRHFYREMLFKTIALNNKRDGVNSWGR